ncbi:MAG: alpha/beta hydrolase [Pseudomonadota bacterium]
MTRPDAGGNAQTAPPKVRLDQAVGRYAHIDIGGRAHRIYFEEAGQGIPLLCLHTAGADARQYRHLLEDPDITQHYRVIAFDMPWHGKSNPPDGFEREAYALTTAGYTELILAVADALALERPVLMGCSIGGRIVLNIAADHAERFRALIGLESAAFQAPWYDTDWLNRPDVHGGEVCAALISGLVPPTAPSTNRAEILWHYKQGGPGIFKGDLYFYRVDGDLRPKLAEIDTAICPLYLLTGEYDYSCTPGDTRAAAAEIAGAQVTIMEKLGHFPMAEDPPRFKAYLMPVLDAIRGATTAERAG